MEAPLWAVPAFPLGGALALALFGRRLGRRATAWIGSGSAGLSALALLSAGAGFIARGAMSEERPGWRWMTAGGFEARFDLTLDPLSLVMAFVVTFVGFFVHLYSVEFMAGEEGYARYFAWLNLFVASMLLLVLAADLPLLYLGWEAVGLCSYLLIGFRYRDPANGEAARKAFIVTRLGDCALLAGILLLITGLGTARIEPLLQRALWLWPAGTPWPETAAALILAGALGKSAQIPLQVWLPGAMAAPTPVSALIHAATMVTAGVYLVARLHPLFTLAPAVLGLVASIGATTLLLAALSALRERDIKRLLAYSTMSQIGYMFLALGVGAWSAALFHLVTHAFFKALLFLSAGAVILALEGERDIFRMGGLRRELPVAFWGFVAGGLSLAALPLLGAGFFSKEAVMAGVERAGGGEFLRLAAWSGSLLTAAYVGRLFQLVCLGPARRPARRPVGWRMALPIVLLSLVALTAGWGEIPPWLGGRTLLTAFLAPLFGRPPDVTAGWGAILLAAAAPLTGVTLGLLLGRRERAAGPPDTLFDRLARGGFGFDRLYAAAFRRPLIALSRAASGEPFDRLNAAVALLHHLAWRLLNRLQNGSLRRYASGVALGTVLLLAVALL